MGHGRRDDEAERPRTETLRPPAQGGVERVSVPAPAPSERDGAERPSRAARARPSARRSEGAPSEGDPRAEAGGRPVRAELARASLDAMDSSLPERPPPDRQQRIEAAVRELSRAGPEDDAPLRRRVLAFGEEALPALAQAFPGTTWVDLSRPHRPLRSARQLSAVCSAMVSFGDAAVPPVARLLRAPHPAVRLAAALTAADLIHGDLVRPLAARLHDEVPAVRDAAMFALRASALLDEARVLRAELVSTLQDDEVPADWRRRAAWTLGQLRDAEAVPQLVEQLGAGAGVAEAARQALVRLTGRDLGRFRFRWRGWWTRHREEDRAAWLVAALDQGDARLRALAAEELVLLTGAGFDRRRAVATRRGARELAAFYGGLLR